MADGYDSMDDPYAYKGSSTLKNKIGLRNSAELESFELEMTALRAQEALPSGNLDARHYTRIHRHIFQDVYAWAGKYRTVLTSKGGNPFCYPDYIDREMDKLFATIGRTIQAKDENQFFTEAARFLGELNAIHPFREGNGRAQLAFMSLVSQRSQFPLDFSLVRRETFLPAMVASYSGDLGPLIAELRSLRKPT